MLALVNKKKKLWFQNVASSWKDADKINDYKKMRRTVKKATKTAIIQFKESLANDKKNPKRLFSYINSKQKIKTKLNTMRTNSGDVTSDKVEIANLLNQHFK